MVNWFICRCKYAPSNISRNTTAITFIDLYCVQCDKGCAKRSGLHSAPLYKIYLWLDIVHYIISTWGVRGNNKLARYPPLSPFHLPQITSGRVAELEKIATNFVLCKTEIFIIAHATPPGLLCGSIIYSCWMMLSVITFKALCSSQNWKGC